MLSVGKLVREVGTTGPFNGRVIKVESGQALVAWWSDRLKDYDRRDADWMSTDRLEAYTIEPGKEGPAALAAMFRFS